MDSRDDAESIRTIHRALELGITMLDTADMYGIGDNEVLVGKAIAEHRDRVILRDEVRHRSSTPTIRRSAASTGAGVRRSPRATRRSSA